MSVALSHVIYPQADQVGSCLIFDVKGNAFRLIVDRLMRKPKLTRAEDDLLELLASLVAQYEQSRFPAPDVTPGEMLAHLLEARGATVADVAAETAIPKRKLAKFLDGSQAIDATNRARLAKFFHVPPDLFLLDE